MWRTNFPMGRTRFSQRTARPADAAGLLGTLAIAGLLAGAAARATAQEADPAARYVTDPAVEPEPVLQASPFRLRGLGDFAITSLRPAGTARWFVTNSGPGDTFGFFSALPGGVLGTAWAPSSYVSQFFELQFWAGAPASEWRKHRDLVPSLENIKNREGLNPGYNVRLNLQRWAPDLHWAFQGKDGTLGKLHSGVTTTDDGSCRDHSRPQFSSITTGVPLLPGSDCPPTWGSLGWQGDRPVPAASWARLARERGNAFTFDFWRVPPELKNQNKTLGDFQTYGITVDYGLEARARFGKVIPGQSGEPLLEGYPMGLEIRFDAFTFQLSTVANAYFYQMLLINSSKEVYGVGLDYDSLYFGVVIRPFHVRQEPTVYAIPEKGAVVSDVIGKHPNCNGARRVGDIRPCNTAAPRGFQAGASGVIVLKSPIGDLRNKLFTRGDPQTNPFYNPNHPQRGDTITFNHNNLCGFTCTQAQHIQGAGTSYQAARSFGTMAHKEALALNDRVSADLTERQYFDLFHNEDWPARWTPATGYVGGFNRYVPGVHDNKPLWRYTNRPKGATAPGPDTLYLGSCGRKGCVTPWSDTLPGGFPNNTHNAAWVGAGPFPLAAGDTTAFVFAFIAAADSISMELLIDRVIDFYMNFYLGPEAPTPPRIVGTSVRGGARGANETGVTLYFDESATRWVDPFFDDFARKMETAVLPDPLARIRTLNPWLPDSIRARAARGELVLRDTDDPCGTGAPSCTFVLNGGARLHILRPDPNGSTPNNRSAAVKLVGPDSASFTMWFAGDAEREEIAWFDAGADYDAAPGMDVDVLKADHHGSCNGITGAYLDRLTPAWVVVGVGADNTYGHIHTQTKDLLRSRGIPWCRTDQNGTITIRAPASPGGGYTIAPTRGSASRDGPSDRTSSQTVCQTM